MNYQGRGNKQNKFSDALEIKKDFANIIIENNDTLV